MHALGKSVHTSFVSDTGIPVFRSLDKRGQTGVGCLRSHLCGAVSKIIISDRFSANTSISVHRQPSLRAFSYLCAEIAISARRDRTLFLGNNA